MNVTVTVTGTASGGYLTVWPCGQSRPLSSSVNFVAGDTVANAVISKVGEGGRVCVFSSAGTNLVVDVNGYFSPAY